MVDPFKLPDLSESYDRISKSMEAFYRVGKASGDIMADRIKEQTDWIEKVLAPSREMTARLEQAFKDITHGR